MNKDYSQLRGMKILMVDDTPVNLDVLSRTLSKSGFEISIATDGEMALKVASYVLPDLILLDIMMPGIDGFETCVKLKNDPATKNIPVIFLSAKEDPADIVKGFQCGGCDYITKPFAKDEVLVRVGTQLQLQEKTKRLERAQIEIKRYAEELERSNADLKMFASVASHDLKSPLRKIRQLGDILLESYETTSVERGKDILERISKNAEQLSQLIDSVLEFSDLETTPKLFEPCDLKQVLEKVVENLEVQTREAGAKIIIKGLPVIDGEPQLFYQLFQNIVSNALKFRRDNVGPVINISSSYCDDTKRWRIDVSDNGIGIAEKYFDRIFQPFERLHGKSDIEGSGIGLATCQRIVNRFNGEISVRNNPENGATFVVILPEKQQ